MDADAPKPPMSLADFVRNHLAIANALLLAAGFAVSFVDFISPALHPAAMRLIYALVAAPVVLTIGAAFFPGTVGRLLTLLGLRSSGGVPGWRRPAWRFAMLVAAGMALFGIVSMAKAGSGGVIASAVPQARELQARLLDIRAEVGAVREGVDAANSKLDRIAEAVDPDNAADKCPDIACAVSEGATPKAIKRLIARGAKLPEDKPNRGELARRLAQSKAPGRFEAIELLIAQGLDPLAKANVMVLSNAELAPEGGRLAMDAAAAMGLSREDLAAEPFDAKVLGLSVEAVAWNKLAGCMLSARGGASMPELAAMRGDTDLAAWLEERGFKPEPRFVACPWQWTPERQARAPDVAVEIDKGRAQVVRGSGAVAKGK